MQGLGQLLQSGDWKGEKHVPVIHIPERIKAGEEFEVKVVVGEEIRHPNTQEHYISWAKLFYLPEGGKFPIEVGNFSFTAHGEGEVFTDPVATTKIKVSKSGTFYALIYCNIHGLWENSAKLVVE